MQNELPFTDDEDFEADEGYYEGPGDYLEEPPYDGVDDLVLDVLTGAVLGAVEEARTEQEQ